MHPGEESATGRGGMKIDADEPHGPHRYAPCFPPGKDPDLHDACLSLVCKIMLVMRLSLQRNPFLQKLAIDLERERTGAIAVRRGSYKSLFLLNSVRFSLENKGNSVLKFGSLKNL